jgi:WD40 repeat protein
VCAGDSGGVKTLAWTPDGKYLLSAVAGRSLRRYDATTCALLGQEDAAVSWEGAMTLSPDGERIAFGMNAGRVQVAKWAEEGGDGFETLYTLDQRVTRFPIVGMAFSPAGRVVASFGSDGALWLWDVLTGEVQARAHPALKVLAAAWSPNAALLAVGSRDGHVQLWKMTGDLPQVADAPGEELAVQPGDTIARNYRPFLDDETLLLNGMMGMRFVVQDVLDHSVLLVNRDSAHSTMVQRSSLLATHFYRVQDE